MRLSLILLLLTCSVYGEVSDKLITALIQVESNGNDKTIGDNGMSKGCLQIWNVVVLDVNRVYKTKYVHDDVFDRELAKEICRLYIKHWSKYYKRKTGLDIDNEGRARLWNSGPRWFKKKEKTNIYWKKVKKVLE
jgi:hypothetical protein